MRFAKIISGEQTGVDRAALDVAIELGIPHGGYCPRGRCTEDGRIPSRYKLVELPHSSYAVRTAANVAECERLLILCPGRHMSSGTLLTREFSRAMGRPLLVASTRTPSTQNASWVRRWLDEPDILMTLMIAGPRESKVPGIYEATRRLLREVLA